LFPVTTFTPESIRKYFENRMPGAALRGTQNTVQCPFHDDGSASLSLNIEKGVWNCHAGCGNGGLVAFEKLFSQCDDGDAWVKISEIMGLSPEGNRPEKIYVYESELGDPIFRVVRYPRDAEGKKSFRQQKFNGKTWDSALTDARRVLYHLPEVLTANQILIVEGEKDADAIRSLDLAADWKAIRVTATTAPGGSSAGTWRDEFSTYFAGKVALILPDNDKPGREHADRVARSVYPYAAVVKIVNLSGLPEKGDVSDFLKDHPKEDLLSAIKATPQWHPPKEVDGEERFFVPAMRMAMTVSDEINWMLKGVIPVGWNGFIIADPKSLKSYSMLDMVMHLSLGKNWMGFTIPKQVRTAIMAREDYWGMTAWRIKHFMRGMVRDNKATGEEVEYLERDGMFVNTQAQAETWYLNEESDVTDLIRRLKAKKVEFLMMDVFRVLFMGEENDSKEMQVILDRVKRIRAEAGCGVGIVHHANKMGQGDIFQRARGTSAIHGFMEWGIGITTENPEDERSQWVRKMQFLTKAGNEPEPIHIKSEGGEEEGYIRLVKTDWVKQKRRTKPADLVSSLPYKED
jgi:AAA domain/CHC2 zinc finger